MLSVVLWAAEQIARGEEPRAQPSSPLVYRPVEALPRRDVRPVARERGRERERRTEGPAQSTERERERKDRAQPAAISLVFPTHTSHGFQRFSARLQEGDWARKVAVGCSAGGRKSNRKNERIRTKCPPSPAHSFIAQLRPTPCRCAKERERERAREEREGRGPNPVHTQHEEGGRERGLGRKDRGPGPVCSNLNGSTLTSEGGGKQAGSLCSRAQKGRSVGDEREGPRAQPSPQHDTPR